MAQEQQNIHVSAPGFAGLNTQESPVEMDIRYASVANNCVIDDQGRISSRNGFQQFTTNLETAYGAGSPTAIGTTRIEKAFEYVDIAGASWMFLCGGGKIWLQHQSKDGYLDQNAEELQLPDFTYVAGGAPSATDNDWDFTSIVDYGYFVQEGFHPLLFDPATDPTSLRLVDLTFVDAGPPVRGPFTGTDGAGTDLDPYTSDLGYPSCVVAAFGHVFYGGWSLNKNIIMFGDLVGYAIGGEQPYIGDLDLTQVWPNGADNIVSMKAHNNFLIIFGERSIVVYEVPDDGVIFSRLVDTLDNIGCISRDSVQTTGKDILFLDHTGVRSFGRTIQEKSMPVGDVSYNVKSEIQVAIDSTIDRNKIFAVYNPEKSLYTITFPELETTYCLDTKQVLDNGSMKITKWTASRLWSGVRAATGFTYFCGVGGAYKYIGGEDRSIVSGGTALVGGSGSDVIAVTPAIYTIPFSYWTQQQSFGIIDKLKILKQLTAAIRGSGETTLFFKWIFEYNGNVNTNFIALEGSQSFEYNGSGASLAEFNDPLGVESGDYDSWPLSYYGGTVVDVSEKRIKLWGNGRIVKFGFEAAVKTNQLAIQELNIQALIGRTA